LDQLTQQNAALAEQSSAAASSLRQQAEGLTQAIAVFKGGAAPA
jgi:methyl-accepting chemotaxis protein